MALPDLGFDPAHVFIDGRWRAGESGAHLALEDPSSGQEIGEIARGSGVDIDAAVAAAQSAQQGAWGQMSAADRGRALARYLEFYGGAADKLHGQTIPYLAGYTVMTLREPHGVTGHIIPWNYPMQIIGRSVGAALATGNAAVLKPAEDACLSALAFAQIAHDAGLPPGALNVVPGLGAEAGAALAAHKDVQHLSFTGSVPVGAAIQAAAAQNIVPVTLELGGKSPQIVFADADIDAALPFLVGAGIQNAGQTCSAASRILIARPIFDEVAARMAARYRSLVVGPAKRHGLTILHRRRATAPFWPQARSMKMPRPAAITHRPFWSPGLIRPIGLRRMRCLGRCRCSCLLTMRQRPFPSPMALILASLPGFGPKTVRGKCGWRGR